MLKARPAELEGAETDNVAETDAQSRTPHETIVDGPNSKGPLTRISLPVTGSLYVYFPIPNKLWATSSSLSVLYLLLKTPFFMISLLYIL